jgi:hypothetical protein
MRRAVVGAVALCLIGGTAARAQGADDLGGLLAVLQEHFGQSMGEAVLGGQSVFVTAKGSVKLAGAATRSYELTVEAQGPTAVEAARRRDDKVEKLRAVARRFSSTITLGEPSYVAARAVIAPRIAVPATGNPPTVTIPSPNAPTPPGAAAAAGQVTARVPVQFSRPPAAQMPAFLDALREAGVDTLPDTTAAANPLAQLTQIFGLGGAAPTSGTVEEETWSRASAAAMQAARAEAEALAAPAGRHVGAVRQVMLLSRSVQNGEATVSVAARFAFAPEKYGALK